MHTFGKTLSGLVLALTAFTLSSCGGACADLAPPSQRDKEAAANGYEVEREGKWDTECQLEDGRWEQDD